MAEHLRSWTGMKNGYDIGLQLNRLTSSPQEDASEQYIPVIGWFKKARHTEFDGTWSLLHERLVKNYGNCWCRLVTAVGRMYCSFRLVYAGCQKTHRAPFCLFRGVFLRDSGPKDRRLQCLLSNRDPLRYFGLWHQKGRNEDGYRPSQRQKHNSQDDRLMAYWTADGRSKEYDSLEPASQRYCPV